MDYLPRSEKRELILLQSFTFVVSVSSSFGYLGYVFYFILTIPVPPI